MDMDTTIPVENDFNDKLNEIRGEEKEINALPIKKSKKSKVKKTKRDKEEKIRYKKKYNKKKIEWNNKKNILKKYILHLEIILDDKKIYHSSFDIFKTKLEKGEDLSKKIVDKRKEYDNKVEEDNEKKKKKQDDKKILNIIPFNEKKEEINNTAILTEKSCIVCKEVKPMTSFRVTSKKFIKSSNSTKTYEYFYTGCKKCKKKSKSMETQKENINKESPSFNPINNELKLLEYHKDYTDDKIISNDNDDNKEKEEDNSINIKENENETETEKETINIEEKEETEPFKIKTNFISVLQIKNILKEYIERRYEKVICMENYEPNEDYCIKLLEFNATFDQYIRNIIENDQSSRNEYKNKLLPTKSIQWFSVIGIDVFNQMDYLIIEKMFCRYCENSYTRKKGDEMKCCNDYNGNVKHLRVICGIKEKECIKK